MYYIIRTDVDEYLFDCDLGAKEIEVTSMEIEAKQFKSRMQAYWVADRVGGTVLEIK
jgi:hypothetical protein